jgi:hypothetical protein
MELNGGVASPNSRTAEHERDRDFGSDYSFGPINTHRHGLVFYFVFSIYRAFRKTKAL